MIAPRQSQESHPDRDGAETPGLSNDGIISLVGVIVALFIGLTGLIKWRRSHRVTSGDTEMNATSPRDPRDHGHTSPVARGNSTIGFTHPDSSSSSQYPPGAPRVSATNGPGGSFQGETPAKSTGTTAEATEEEGLDGLENGRTQVEIDDPVEEQETEAQPPATKFQTPAIES